MVSTFQILLAVGGVILAAVLAFFGNWVLRVVDSRNKLRDRVTELEADVRVIKAQALPANTLMLSLLAKELTHFHTPVVDKMIARFKDPAIPQFPSKVEEAELVVAMKQRMKEVDTEIDDDERDAAEAFPIMMRRARREAESLANGALFVDTRLIGMLQAGENGK